MSNNNQLALQQSVPQIAGGISLLIHHTTTAEQSAVIRQGLLQLAGQTALLADDRKAGILQGEFAAALHTLTSPIAPGWQQDQAIADLCQLARLMAKYAKDCEYQLQIEQGGPANGTV